LNNIKFGPCGLSFGFGFGFGRRCSWLSASVSASAESQFMTFGRVSVSAETRNSVSVGL